MQVQSETFKESTLLIMRTTFTTKISFISIVNQLKRIGCVFKTLNIVFMWSNDAQ